MKVGLKKREKGIDNESWIEEKRYRDVKIYRGKE